MLVNPPCQTQFLRQAATHLFVMCALFLSALGCEPSSDQTSQMDKPNAQASRPVSPPPVPQHERDSSDPHEVSSSHEAPRSDLPRIVAFGNSLTAGLGVTTEEAYPAQLQRRLEEVGYQVRVINAGVSGETSAGGVRRVDWVLRSKPNVVILELGGNDGLRGINPEQTQANLDQIIRRFREADIPVILAGMRLPPNYGEAFTSRFAAVYHDLAREHRLVLIPFFLEGVATHDDLTQADGIHPTAEGYRVIVDNLLPVLEPVLAQMAVRAS